MYPQLIFHINTPLLIFGIDSQLIVFYLFWGSAWVSLIWGIYAINRDIYLEGQEELYHKPSFLFTLAIPYFRLMGYFIQSFCLTFKPMEKRDASAINYIYTYYVHLEKQILRNVISAGLDWLWKPYEFIGAIFISGVAGFAFSLFFYAYWGWIVVVPLFTTAAFIAPYYLLNMVAYNRKRQIFKALPFCLDLICFYAEAGLDFTVAMERMVKELKRGPMREELMRVVRELKMGKTRAEAMKDLGERVDLQDLSVVCGAIVHCDEMGANLTHVLKVQSSSLRFKRFRQAEEAAMKAPVKMLFPLLCFVFPTIFLVIFGPWIAQILGE